MATDTPMETRSFEDVYVIQTNRIGELERELAETKRLLVEASKDAERYRWLRKHTPLYDGDVRCSVSRGRGPVSPDWSEVAGKKLDEAIDAAIKEQP